MTIALIIAGGVGNRMGQDIPKQFLNVYDKPVIIYTLEAFQNHPNIDAIEVVCLEGWHEILRAYCRQFRITKLEGIVNDGATGQESIFNGLSDIATRHSDNEDIVLVHDSIRPMVSHDIISNAISTCRLYGNAVVSIPCAEAMLISHDGKSSGEQIVRDMLKRTQTPQVFYLQEILEVHREAQKKGITNSVASCTLFIEMGRSVFFSPGSEKNIKLTTVDDLEIFKALLNSNKSGWIK